MTTGFFMAEPERRHLTDNQIAVAICWVKKHRHLQGNPTNSCRWSRTEALQRFKTGLAQLSYLRDETP